MGLFDWLNSRRPQPPVPPPLAAPHDEHEHCRFMLAADHASGFQGRLADLEAAANNPDLLHLIRSGHEIATGLLADRFGSLGYQVVHEPPRVCLPDLRLGFQCKAMLETFRPGFTGVFVGVELDPTDSTDGPITFYQLGACLDAPGNFAAAAGHAFDQWFEGVWPPVLDLLLVLRGDQPLHTPVRTEWGDLDRPAGPDDEVYWVFKGPPWVGLTDEIGRWALEARLREWPVYEQALEPHVVELFTNDPGRDVCWAKAYLGHSPFGEVFGEVKLNNEDAHEAFHSLATFPWPHEMRARGGAFKTFSLVLRGDPQSQTPKRFVR